MNDESSSVQTPIPMPILLELLPRSLKQGLLSNPSRSARLGIESRLMSNIGPQLRFDHEALVDAIRRTFGGEEGVLLEAQDGKSATLSLTAEGIVMTSGEERFTLGDVAVLSLDLVQRLDGFDTIGRGLLSLPKDWPDLREQLQSQPATTNCYRRLERLSSTSPLKLLTKLKKRFASGHLRPDDLCPLEDEYWQSLLGTGSEFRGDLSELANGLSEARLLMLKHSGLAAALPFILSSAGSAAFSATGALGATSTQELASAVDSIKSDLTVLCSVGLLEVIAARTATADADALAKAIAAPLIDENRKEFERSSEIFTTAFRFCLVHLSGASRFARSPWHWRRLAAFTQANVISSVIGKSTNDDLLKWMWRQTTAKFPVRIAMDAVEAPRWRDDWSSIQMTVSEAVGRLRGIAIKNPEAIKRWGLSNGLEQLRVDAEKVSGPASTGYAGPMEARRDSAINSDDALLQELEAATLEGLAASEGLELLSRIIFTASVGPFSAKVGAAMDTVLSKTSVTILREHGLSAAGVLHGLGWAASVFGSKGLADDVLRLCMGLERHERDREVRLHIIALLYAGAAFATKPERRAYLDRAFRNIGFSVEARDAAWGAWDMFGEIVAFDPDAASDLAMATTATRAAAMRR